MGQSASGFVGGLLSSAVIRPMQQHKYCIGLINIEYSAFMISLPTLYDFRHSVGAILLLHQF
jgi:hypothetical protein